MPDISANQFVYSKGLKTIAGVVDLDSYVLGPIEMELTVLEMCVTNVETFMNAYQKRANFPINYEKTRNLFRLGMWLQEPNRSETWETFSTRNILFM